MTAKLGTGRSFFCIHVFTQHIAKGKASNGKTNSCYDIRHNITSPLLMYLVKSQDQNAGGSIQMPSREEGQPPTVW
jgi:hypothetical protein